MTNEQLIEQLQKLPPKDEVRYVYDGSDYGNIAEVWRSRDGQVLLANFREDICRDQIRLWPVGAHEADGFPWWSTQDDPNRETDED